ncbi:unnamed protein product, partial [marine sediment metagenome]
MMNTLKNDNHIDFCERYFVEASEEICEKCKYDVEYRMNLIGNRIKTMEDNHGLEMRFCKHRTEEFAAEKRLCNGQSKEITMFHCAKFNEKREKAYCVACSEYSGCSKSGKIIVYGFPSYYGGAQTELHHQIKVW